MSRTTPGGRILDFVKIFYFIVIPVTIGLMLLHNLLDLRRKARAALARYRQSPGQIRLTLSERWQHVLLLVSFIVLVITGFALKFPGNMACPSAAGFTASPVSSSSALRCTTSSTCP